MDIPVLLSVARSILAVNPKARLSGSLALHIHGLRLPREVKDIDIYLPCNEYFSIIPGMVIGNGNGDEEKHRYDESNYEREAWKKIFGAGPLTNQGIAVDIFRPVEEQYNYPENYFEDHDGLLLLPKTEILKHKIDHALDKNYSRWKHRDDMLFILLQNIKP